MPECLVPKKYSATERHARKEYGCCECTAKIRKGEIYLMCSGLWEDRYENHRQHITCAEACMHIRDHFNEGECIYFGGLIEWYENAKHNIDRYRGDTATREFRTLMAKVLWRQRHEMQQVL